MSMEYCRECDRMWDSDYIDECECEEKGEVL